MSEPVMVFGKDYCPPREKDRWRRDRSGHYMGCVGGTGCAACCCGGNGDDFLWMTEVEAKRSGAQFDRDASAYAEIRAAERIEVDTDQQVANRIADWLDDNGYLAPTQLIREGRWRKP